MGGWVTGGWVGESLEDGWVSHWRMGEWVIGGWVGE